MIPYGPDQGGHPAEKDAPLFARLAARFGIGCPAKVGPIPKLHGHTCRCNRLRPHRMPHTCDCGAWFEPRVTPPVETAPERDRAAEVAAAEDRAEQAAFDAARERS